ncbi:MAG: NADH:ubiquinone reductase (Na(+)-transporting) subunit C [Bacteroidales bacterium]|nr:NADH:ubiquinone reductase (Na(+)-transporting) subunit C [Bacteroidales bacterium]
MYSNFYIFKYSAIMVILVAALLSTAAMLLKPAQDRNLEIEKMKSILASANIEATSDDAIDLYKKYITKEIVLNPEGKQIDLYENGEFIDGDERAFDIDLKKQLYRKKNNENYQLPLFVCKKGSETLFIIPLLGKGLWGPVWGNIALKSDFTLVEGVTFGHKSETPGLGAEIDTKEFQKQFIGKRIFNNLGEFTSIKVVKGGIDLLPQNLKIHGVDAISGGTITSNSVADMLNNNLSSYVPYFKKNR